MSEGDGTIREEVPKGLQGLLDQLDQQPPEVQEVIRDLIRPRGPSDPKRHHYVPQFYLRRFARDDGSVHRIGTVPLDDPSAVRIGAVEDTAVIGDFYTIVGDDNEDSLMVERLLGRVEADASKPLVRLATGVLFPPQPSDRFRLALFVALQWVRGPRQRRTMEAMAETATKLQMSMARSGEEVREILWEVEGVEPDAARVAQVMDAIRDGQDWEVVTSQNELISLMLNTAMEIAPSLFERHWCIVRYTEAGLITSDSPVFLHTYPENRDPLRGVGIGTADEVNMALDRRTLLTLHSDDRVGDRVLQAQPDQTVDEANQFIVSGARHAVYAHPDDLDRVARLHLPDPDVPLFQMEGGAWTQPYSDGVNKAPDRTSPHRYRKARGKR